MDTNDRQAERAQAQADVLKRVKYELGRAEALLPPYHTAHEAYGVLAEEVQELFDAVRLPQRDRDRGARLRNEAYDVAVVALRIALHMDDERARR